MKPVQSKAIPSSSDPTTEKVVSSEKLDLRSQDIANEKVFDLLRLFPEARNETGRIDFERLKLALGESVDVGRERYGMNWPGKADCFKVIQAPSMGTLRPCPEESVNWDATQNIFIEGDNLEVLKLLQKSYHKKIKMICIDPPYNTGKDFIYPDNFHDSIKTYLELTGQTDSQGRKLSTNQQTSGRYHTNWLNMMYPRLYLARNLLCEDGVIFIFIDDKEVANLRKICDEVFGEENFVAVAAWEKKNKGAFLANDITNMKDYVVMYCREKTSFDGLIGQIVEEEETYPCVNASNAREIRTIPAGIKSNYREHNYILPKGNRISVDTMNLLLHSDLVIKNGVLANDLVIEGNWRYRQEMMTEYAQTGDLYITQDLYLRRIVREPRKKTLRDLFPRLGTSGQAAKNVINQNDLFEDGWGTNEDANEELRVLLGEQNLLDYPKPVRLISKLICSIRDKNALVCDFFAGSGTTAQAVLEQNKADGGNRKFIMVQLPEPLGPNDLKQKTAHDFCTANGLKPNIAEIGKERIRRAIKQINDEDVQTASEKVQNPALFSSAVPPTLDRGFKVFKLADSNFTTWDAQIAHEAPALEGQLELHVDHIRDGRTHDDILYELVLKSETKSESPLVAKVEKISLAGKTVFSVAGGELMVCLEPNLTLDLIRAIADRKPGRVIFLDAGFAGNDQLMANAAQTFKAKGVTAFHTV